VGGAGRSVLGDVTSVALVARGAHLVVQVRVVEVLVGIVVVVGLLAARARRRRALVAAARRVVRRRAPVQYAPDPI